LLVQDLPGLDGLLELGTQVSVIARVLDLNLRRGSAALVPRLRESLANLRHCRGSHHQPYGQHRYQQHQLLQLLTPFVH
jgi:hypothetical protein